MTVGYIRVSAADQNPARQEEAFKNHGVERVFEEKISGKDMNRPKLRELLDFVREGDTVIVESYSRLARSTKDLLLIIDKLQEKKVSFVSLKENIDTTTPQGKLMLTIFAGLSQFERECTLQRQAEGIAIAKAEGKYKGRKPIAKPTEWDYVIGLYKAKELTAAQAQKRLGLSRATFYRMLNARNKA